MVNFEESTTILNACTKKSGNLLKAPCVCINKYIYISSKKMPYVLLTFQSLQGCHKISHN